MNRNTLLVRWQWLFALGCRSPWIDRINIYIGISSSFFCPHCFHTILPTRNNDTCISDFMRQSSLWSDSIFSSFHHWKVLFVIFNNGHFLWRIKHTTTRGEKWNCSIPSKCLKLGDFATHTRYQHARTCICCLFWVVYQQCRKNRNAVKITYYLHTNIFQLFSCQVSVCVDRLAAFYEFCDT